MRDYSHNGYGYGHSWPIGFMTNTSVDNRSALDKCLEKFPGAVEIRGDAVDGLGRPLYGFVAVHKGPKPLPDYGEFWREFDRHLVDSGLRVKT